MPPQLPGNVNNRFDWNKAFKRAFWHGGSSFDAWLTVSSFQVAQVLLNLPYSYAQLGIASGSALQILYGFMGCWACYVMMCLYLTYKEQHVNLENHTIQWYEVLDGLLGPWWKRGSLFFTGASVFFGATIQFMGCASTVYYLNDSLDKRTWTLIFGSGLIITALIPTAHNYRLWSFFGVVMTTFVAWYMTIAAIVHGKEQGVTHKAPTSFMGYYVGATNILFAFGGHSLTIEFAEAMWKPKRFEVIYFYAILYIFTLTIPSATAVYWAFGDKMLQNSNAFAVLPSSKYRDAAIVLMLIHQFVEVGMVMLPLYFMFEKLFNIHHSKHYALRTLARIPICLAVWFVAVMLPFFGSVDSLIGSFIASFSVYTIPCLAHMAFYRTAVNRKNSAEKPPFWLPGGWLGMYCINIVIVTWVIAVGTGLGGWASIVNFCDQVHSFGLFSKCYQCPPRME